MILIGVINHSKVLKYDDRLILPLLTFENGDKLSLNFAAMNQITEGLKTILYINALRGALVTRSRCFGSLSNFVWGKLIAHTGT